MTQSLDLTSVYRCCLTAALCSQKYVLNDLLHIKETLSGHEEHGLAAACRRASQGHHLRVVSDGDVTPTQGDDTRNAGDSCECGVGASFEGSSSSRNISSEHGMLLSAAQQRQLTVSINMNLEVESKGELAHRATSTTDFVTTADKVVQDVVVAMLQGEFGHEPPFSIIGEEDNDEATLDAVAVRKCREEYAPLFDQHPFLVELSEHAQKLWDLELDCVLHDSVDALRRRVSVFIDPIDGTGAFVDGELHVPMTLIGVAVDGRPVIGVINQVFMTNADGDPNPSSLSVACCSLRDSVPFVRVSGVAIDAPAALRSRGSTASNHPRCETGASPVAGEETLVVTYSSSTKASVMQPVLDKLHPFHGAPARGAGFKSMMVVRHVCFSAGADNAANVYVTPNDAIKKWDTCAPHAILAALGGAASNIVGDPIDYRPLFQEGILVKKPTYALAKGFVACSSSGIREMVSARLGWTS